MASITSILVLSHLSCFSSPQTWRQHKQGDPWPGRRFCHIAACIGYGGKHQRLLISGGFCVGGVIYDDMWLMDPQSGRMEKVRIVLEDLSSQMFRVEDQLSVLFSDRILGTNWLILRLKNQFSLI